MYDKKLPNLGYNQLLGKRRLLNLIRFGIFEGSLIRLYIFKIFQGVIGEEKNKSVSIVILNYNGISDTIECIESLNKISTPEFNVIIVDNGSKEDEAKIIKSKLGNGVITIRSDTNFGFAGGNNLGIKYALGHIFSEYTLLLNNDTIVEPNFLSKLLFGIKKDGRIGGCSA